MDRVICDVIYEHCLLPFMGAALGREIQGIIGFVQKKDNRDGIQPESFQMVSTKYPGCGKGKILFN